MRGATARLPKIHSGPISDLITTFRTTRGSSRAIRGNSRRRAMSTFGKPALSIDSLCRRGKETDDEHKAQNELGNSWRDNRGRWRSAPRLRLKQRPEHGTESLRQTPTHQ